MGHLKNLIVFISPKRSFSGPYERYTKVQIDNSLDLGWKPEDILIVANFDWEYNGVKTIKVGDEHYCAVRPRSIKTTIIPYLVEEDIIEDDHIYWNHDLDAWEQSRIKIEDLGLNGIDVGLTDYGWRPRWCLGSYFVKASAKDIFEKMKPIIFSNIEDETAMMNLTEDQTIAKRCKRLNVTYNFGMRFVERNWRRADKPLKVLHFHPYSPRVPTLDIFMYGKNGLNMPLMDERLTKIFNSHDIK